MKKFLLTVIFAFICFLSFAQGKLPVVAITPLQIISGVNAEEARMITDVFYTRLGNRWQYLTLVDRTVVEQIIKEHNFQLGDWSSRDKTAALGNALNANWILRGNIRSSGGGILIIVEFYDINTLAFRGSTDLRLANADAAYDKMDEIVNKLIQAITGTNVAQEYTIYYSGGVGSGVVKIKREPNGIITITPTWSNNSLVRVSPILCPLLPGTFGIYSNLREIKIDGNTITTTNLDGRQWRRTVDSNTTTEEVPNTGWVIRTVVDGNFTTRTNLYNGELERIVKNGNIETVTFPSGEWAKKEVNGNTTTITTSTGSVQKTVVNGNVTTRTYDGTLDNFTKMVRDGNTITLTQTLEGKTSLLMKVEFQGNNVFVEQAFTDLSFGADYSLVNETDWIARCRSWIFGI